MNGDKMKDSIPVGKVDYAIDDVFFAEPIKVAHLGVYVVYSVTNLQFQGKNFIVDTAHPSNNYRYYCSFKLEVFGCATSPPSIPTFDETSGILQVKPLIVKPKFKLTLPVIARSTGPRESTVDSCGLM